MDPDSMTCGELLLSLKEQNKEELVLFHLPDNLPGEPRLKEDEKPGTKSKQEENNNNVARVTLEDLSEGCMGKIQILKSGKARLVLGDVAMDMEMGAPVGFLQDLVSIHTNRDSGEMSTIGHVNHVIVCTPKMDQIN